MQVESTHLCAKTKRCKNAKTLTHRFHPSSIMYLYLHLPLTTKKPSKQPSLTKPKSKKTELYNSSLFLPSFSFSSSAFLFSSFCNSSCTSTFFSPVSPLTLLAKPATSSS